MADQDTRPTIPTGYPTTENYGLGYFDGQSYANFVKVLSPDIQAIDTQMKKNEMAAKEKNELIDEVSEQVVNLNDTVTELSGSVTTVNQTANSAFTTAQSAANTANAASETANRTSEAQQTLADDFTEIENQFETVNQQVNTNKENITTLTNTVNTSTEKVTEVEGKLNTTNANVQKLEAGFDNFLGGSGTQKFATFSVTDESSDIYNIRVNLPEDAIGKFVYFENKTVISSVNPFNSLMGLAPILDGCPGIVTVNVYRKSGVINLIIRGFLNCISSDTYADIKISRDEWVSLTSVNIINLDFPNSKLYMFSLPQVSITPPS